MLSKASSKTAYLRAVDCFKGRGGESHSAS